MRQKLDKDTGLFMKYYNKGKVSPIYTFDICRYMLLLLILLYCSYIAKLSIFESGQKQKQIKF